MLYRVVSRSLVDVSQSLAVLFILSCFTFSSSTVLTEFSGVVLFHAVLVLLF